VARAADVQSHTKHEIKKVILDVTKVGFDTPTVRVSVDCVSFAGRGWGPRAEGEKRRTMTWPKMIFRLRR
jgi:hypothetical protein